MTPEAPSHRPPALAVRGVTKTFFGNVALGSLDLDIAAGEIHALLGENGSGKSTLIKILSGYHQPDAGGDVHIGGHRLEFGAAHASYTHGGRFVHQDLGLIDSCSIADNLALNAGFPCRFGTVRRTALLRSANNDLARVGLDLDPDRLVGTLAPAERTGVAVARALHEDPASPVALLVLDEPTATLPQAEVERLLLIVRTAASSGVGVLYVTHRLDEVFQVASALTVLRDGRRVAQVPVSTVNRAQLVTLLVGTEFEDVRAVSEQLPVDHDEPLLVAEGIVGGSIAGVSLEIRPGDIVGVAGITGSGREILLSMVFGATARAAGTVRVGDVQLRGSRPDLSMQAGMAFLSADRKSQGGFGDLTVRENMSITDLRPYWRWPKLSRRNEIADARRWINRLSVRPASPEVSLSMLSGGNQQKVLFARWMRRSPCLLLLDEPTQGVDIGAKADLHAELLDLASRGAGIIVSSSDADELGALCHRVLVLRDGKIAADLTGARVAVAEISRACLGTDDRISA